MKEQTILKIKPLSNGDSYPYLMINLLSDKGFKKDWIKDIKNLNDLEQHIFKLVRDYSETDSDNETLLMVFHLIQIWGGYSGNHIYLDNETGFNWDEIKEPYKELVHSCISITEDVTDEKAREGVFNAICKFNEEISNIGISFITKHTRFWTSKKLGVNMLPIYDSIMAAYHKKNGKKPWNIKNYWAWMISQRHEGESLADTERRLFNLARRESRE